MISTIMPLLNRLGLILLETDPLMIAGLALMVIKLL